MPAESAVPTHEWRISTPVRIAAAVFGSIFTVGLTYGFFFMDGHVIGLILAIIIGAAAYLGAFRPHLAVVGDRITARNPIGSFDIAASDVSSVKPTYEGIEFVLVDGSVKSARAVQKSNLGSMFGKNTRSDQVAAELHALLGLD